MNCLFYCHGDDGRMLQAFQNAISASSLDCKLINAHDTEQAWSRESITVAIVWMPPEDFFEGLTDLTHVYALAAGVDQLLQHRSLPEHVEVVRLHDAGMATQMAEYVLYGVLRAQRSFHLLDSAQKSARWVNSVPVKSVTEMRVGILGAGILASEVARRLVVNGYPVTCWSRSRRPSSDGVVNVCGPESLPGLLSASDVLVCLLPLTADTEAILNSNLFDQLPTGAFLINCARGAHLVDEDLIAAINEQKLSGAMLDVFNAEPLPEKHPFWHHPQIFVTPHVAAQTSVTEAVTQIMSNIEKVERGEKPNGIVDRSTGY